VRRGNSERGEARRGEVECGGPYSSVNDVLGAGESIGHGRGHTEAWVRGRVWRGGEKN